MPVKKHWLLGGLVSGPFAVAGVLFGSVELFLGAIAGVFICAFYLKKYDW
jgi:hypothetical protein